LAGDLDCTKSIRFYKLGIKKTVSTFIKMGSSILLLQSSYISPFFTIPLRLNKLMNICELVKGSNIIV